MVDKITLHQNVLFRNTTIYCDVKTSYNTAAWLCIEGCQAEEYMGSTWPDTRLGAGAISSACPCEELFGAFAGNVKRSCTENSVNGAMWSTELDFSGCEVNASDVSRQLCDIALVSECII